MKQGIIYTLVTVALVVASFFIGRGTRRTPTISPDNGKVDTLYIRDTLRPETEVIERHLLDTILVPVTDTIRSTDTVYVRLPRTQIVEAGDGFKAWISGYRPALDSIVTYPERVVITERIPEPFKPWSLSASAGYTNTFGPDLIGSPYANIKLGYQHPSARRWSFGVEGGYQGNVMKGSISGAPYVEIWAEFKIFSW